MILNPIMIRVIHDYRHKIISAPIQPDGRSAADQTITVNAVYSDCCSLSMSVLALCIKAYFTEEEASFICNLLHDVIPALQPLSQLAVLTTGEVDQSTSSKAQ